MWCPTLQQLSLTAFVIDVYLDVAASALATNVVLRSAFGAGFPVSPRFPLNLLNVTDIN